MFQITDFNVYQPKHSCFLNIVYLVFIKTEMQHLKCFLCPMSYIRYVTINMQWKDYYVHKKGLDRVSFFQWTVFQQSLKFLSTFF